MIRIVWKFRARHWVIFVSTALLGIHFITGCTAGRLNGSPSVEKRSRAKGRADTMSVVINKEAVKTLGSTKDSVPEKSPGELAPDTASELSLFFRLIPFKTILPLDTMKQVPAPPESTALPQITDTTATASLSQSDKAKKRPRPPRVAPRQQDSCTNGICKIISDRGTKKSKPRPAIKAHGPVLALPDDGHSLLIPVDLSGDARSIELTDATGNRSVTLGKLPASFLLVHFWATSCRPCRKELPAFADFIASPGFRQLQDTYDCHALLVSTDSSFKKASDYLSGKRLKGLTLLVDAMGSRLLPIVSSSGRSIPLTVLLRTSDGKVIQEWRGSQDWSALTIRTSLNAALVANH